MKHWLKLTLLFASLAACQIDLPVASEIEHMRVLTAVSAVDGDPERASPAPGETARVTWTMAYPDHAQDDSELASMFYVCTAPDRFSGTPVCQEFIDLLGAGSGAAAAAFGGSLGAAVPDCAQDPDREWDLGPFRLVCVTGTPALDISIADSYKASAKLMQGIICRNGTPRFELGEQPRLVCDEDRGASGEREEISVYGTVPVQYDADTENRNPRTDGFELSFGTGPSKMWAESDELLDDEVNDESCEELAGSNRLKLSSNHREAREEEITLGYNADAREMFEGKPEPLTFSIYTTFGSLSARFTVFRSDAKAPLERKIKWELSDEEREQLKKSSKFVRFYFTVQDGRGGYAITRRDLCVTR